MNISQLDADGNFVDGMYWHLLAESFEKAVEGFRRAGNDGAVALAWRLLETVDDVPADLVQQQQDFWNVPYEEDVPNPAQLPEDIHDEMIAEIGRAEYAPGDATAFITEFIRRVHEAQGIGGSWRKVTEDDA